MHEFAIVGEDNQTSGILIKPSGNRQLVNEISLYKLENFRAFALTSLTDIPGRFVQHYSYSIKGLYSCAIKGDFAFQSHVKRNVSDLKTIDSNSPITYYRAALTPAKPDKSRNITV